MQRTAPTQKKINRELMRDKAYGLYRNNKYKEAIALFEQIPGKNALDQVGIAKCHHKAGNSKKAIEILLSLKERKDVLLLLANIFSDRKEFTKTKACLNKITNQNHPQVRYAWINYYFAINDVGTALKLCAQNEKADLKHFHTYCYHAIFLDNTGTQNSAQEALKVLHIFTQKYESIKSQFHRLYKRDYALAQSIMSMIYRNLGDLTNALKFAHAAVAADQTYWLAHNTLGKCFQSLDTKDDQLRANTCFETSRKLNPERFDRVHGNKITNSSQSFEDDVDFDLDHLFQKWMNSDPIKPATKPAIKRDSWWDDEEEKNAQLELKSSTVKERWDEDLDDETPATEVPLSRFYSALDLEDQEEPVSKDSKDNKSATKEVSLALTFEEVGQQKVVLVHKSDPVKTIESQNIIEQKLTLTPKEIFKETKEAPTSLTLQLAENAQQVAPSSFIPPLPDEKRAIPTSTALMQALLNTHDGIDYTNGPLVKIHKVQKNQTSFCVRARQVFDERLASLSCYAQQFYRAVIVSKPIIETEKAPTIRKTK